MAASPQALKRRSVELVATSIVLVLLLTSSWGSTGQAYPAIGSFVRSREKIFLAIILVSITGLQSDFVRDSVHQNHIAGRQNANDRWPGVLATVV